MNATIKHGRKRTRLWGGWVLYLHIYLENDKIITTKEFENLHLLNTWIFNNQIQSLNENRPKK